MIKIWSFKWYRMWTYACKNMLSALDARHQLWCALGSTLMPGINVDPKAHQRWCRASTLMRLDQASTLMCVHPMLMRLDLASTLASTLIPRCINVDAGSRRINVRWCPASTLMPDQGASTLMPGINVDARHQYWCALGSTLMPGINVDPKAHQSWCRASRAESMFLHA